MKQEEVYESFMDSLISDAPSRQYREKMRLFGQFVGDWDIVECNALQPDGSWKTMRGKLHWSWILDGMAVQDVWIGVPDKGTTIRFFDPRSDEWQSVWISPTQGIVRHFRGKAVGNEIILRSKTPDGKLVRWLFYDITSDKFRWRAEESPDDGNSWNKVEEMFVKRDNGRSIS